MAVNLDTRLPLAAISGPLNPAGIIRQAQEFRQQQASNDIAQKLQELRLDYENRKRKREADTEQYMGEELATIAQAKPVTERTEYVWQQPKQVVDRPQPTMEDMQRASITALMRAGDIQGAFEAMKAARAGREAKYGNTLMPSIDRATGELVYIQPGGPSGARVVTGFTPPEGVVQINAGNERVLVGSKTGRESRRIPVSVDPTAIYNQGEQARRQERGAELSVLTTADKERQAQLGRAQGEREVERGLQVEKAQDAIAELSTMRTALSKLPSPWRLRVEGVKAFVGLENPDIQAALGEIERTSGRMLEYVNRLPGAATDADRQIFMASAGVITDKDAPVARKIAAADSAIQSYNRLIQKYGSKKPAVGGGKQSFSSLPPAAKYRGKVATDQQTGIKYKSDGSQWVRVR